MENKRRKSIIWKISKDELEELTTKSNSIAEILRNLGYKKHLTSRLYNILKHRLDEDFINYSHISLGTSSNLNRTFERYTKEDVLEKLKQSRLLQHGDKKRILKFNIIPNDNCSICGIGRIWNNLELKLQLDHIDGNPTNNNVDNLRYLCPNCHTQTETYCYGVKQRNKCIDCGSQITKQSSRCIKCSNKLNGAKIKKFEISDDDLTKLVCDDKLPFTTLGKMFGVSDNAIRKRCKYINIDVKKRIKI